ncbi:hypothetical protein ACP4OV_020989 [Aristida adscensionis]
MLRGEREGEGWALAEQRGGRLAAGGYQQLPASTGEHRKRLFYRGPAIRGDWEEFRAVS